AGARHLVVAVAMDDLDRLGGNAEPLGDETAIDGAMALSARVNPDRQQQLARTGEPDRGALPRLAAGDLQKARDAKAALLPGRFRRRLARGETGNVSAGERVVEHGGEIAAVIGRADRGLVRHAPRRDQVAAAQFEAINTDDPRRLV